MFLFLLSYQPGRSLGVALTVLYLFLNSGESPLPRRKIEHYAAHKEVVANLCMWVVDRWYWKLGKVLHLVPRPTEHFDYREFIIMELFVLYSPGYMVSVLDSF